MTKRSEYEFVRNKRRAEIANNCHADLMIRLHCDANAGSGIAAYAPDRQGTSGGYKGPSATVIDESQKLARPFFDALVGRLRGKLASRGLHPDIATAVGRKQGALTGSIYSEVPVVLVEICVLTNPKDEDFVVSVDGQKQIADALADGVDAAIAARRTSSEPPTVK
jgi:N-acetylmuramoyl-L-alanine amidase